MSAVPSAVRDSVVHRSLADLFAADPGRAERYVVHAGDLRIDYSKHPIDDGLLGALVAWAESAGVAQRRDAMFAGEQINVTEDRAVLHTALRAPAGASVVVDGHDVVPDVHAVLDAMAAFADRVRADERITDVVNIGIGGSDLGPAMAAQALAVVRASPAADPLRVERRRRRHRHDAAGASTRRRRCSSSRRRRSPRSRR